MKTFKQLLENISAIEHPTHLEITPDKYKSGEFSGSTINHRNNHSVYGDNGVSGLDHKIKKSLNDKSNIILNAANKYSKTHLKKSYDSASEHPESSLAKQYVIGKTYELAASHHPEYKKAIFKDYKENRPDIVKNTNAKDYDSLVSGSYHHLANETKNQFHSLPVKTQFHSGNMNYHNSNEMLRDLHGHHNLTVFRGGDRHEFLHNVDKKTGLNENEMFRAVHDAYGHGIHGNQFGAKGEEIAWNAHRKMFSDTAHPAMTAETRGQNSFVNYTHANLSNMKEMEHHRKMRREALNSGNTEEAEKHNSAARSVGDKWNYAKQASVALPSSMLSDKYNGEIPHHISHLLRDKQADKNPVYDVHKDHLNLVDLSTHHNTKSHAALQNAGEFNHKQAHSDLRSMAMVHGFTDISHNPFKEKK